MCITSFFYISPAARRRLFDAHLGSLWHSTIALVLYFSSQDLYKDISRDISFAGPEQLVDNPLYVTVRKNTKRLMGS